MAPEFKPRFAIYAVAGLIAGAGGLVTLFFFAQSPGSLRARDVTPSDCPLERPSAESLVNAVESSAESTNREEPGACGEFSSTSDDELFVIARDRATASLEKALAWAQSQVDRTDRERLLFAIVQVWAETDPVGAARWALAREHAGTERFMEAALAGAVRQPRLALEIGRMLLAADPEVGAAHGATLVGALTGVGEFNIAFQFADAAPAELREEWLAAAFRRWGAQKPEEALITLRSLADDDASRGSAFRSLAEGWAEQSPAALVSFVSGMPLSPDREVVLIKAFAKWGLQDPAALAAWLNTLSPGPTFDHGVAALLARSDQANRSIEVGLHWAESISNRELRYESLGHVLADWQQSQPTSARGYLAGISWLTTEERSDMIRRLDAEISLSPEI